MPRARCRSDLAFSVGRRVDRDIDRGVDEMPSVFPELGPEGRAAYGWDKGWGRNGVKVEK